MNLVTLTGLYNKYREDLDKKGKGLIASSQTLLISFLTRDIALVKLNREE